MYTCMYKYIYIYTRVYIYIGICIYLNGICIYLGVTHVTSYEIKSGSFHFRQGRRCGPCDGPSGKELMASCCCSGEDLGKRHSDVV